MQKQESNPASFYEKKKVTQEQYRKIVQRDWKDPVLNGTTPDTTVIFWSWILQVQTSLAGTPFEEY